MSMVNLVKATMENWEEAYEVFYRSLRKLISEGTDELFGGMDRDRTKQSIQGNNSMYLLRREGDKIPVVAISVLRKEEYDEYEDVLTAAFQTAKIPTKKVVLLNAIACRPELQGQGYARQAVALLREELKKEGVEVVVCIAHPDNRPGQSTLVDMSKDNALFTSKEYTWKTPRGRQLERARFAFFI